MFKAATSNALVYRPAGCFPSTLASVSNLHTRSRFLHSNLNGDVFLSKHGVDSIEGATPAISSNATRHPRTARKFSANRNEKTDAQPTITKELRRTEIWNNFLKANEEVKYAASSTSVSASARIAKKGASALETKRRKWKDGVAKQKSLRPAVQAMRVKELAQEGELEQAISLVYGAPQHSLNVIVWTTLLHVLTRASRRKRAYEVYSEMKRRGYSPISSTYSTMLFGMNMIDDWSTNLENLERCHKLYEAFVCHVEKCNSEGLRDLTISSGPRTAYIRILGKSGNFQKIVDIFYGTGDSGPLARDKFLYSSLFIALAMRKESEKSGTLSIKEQNASDARFFWRTLEKDIERGMDVLDTQVVYEFLRVVADGRPVDQQFGLEVAHKYLGLVGPGEERPPNCLPLTNPTLRAILELCNKSSKYRLCVYFLKYVVEQQRLKAPYVSDIEINAIHITEQLIALRQLSSVGSYNESARAVDAIRHLVRSAALQGFKPGRMSLLASQMTLRCDTVTLALTVCWHCRDWESAAEIYSLVTSVPAEDFLDDGPIAKGQTPRIWPRGLLQAVSLWHMARTALSTEDKSKMRQFLRMMSASNVNTETSEELSQSRQNFYRLELAKAVVKIASTVSSGWTGEEKKTWKAIKVKSIEVLSKRVTVERPEREDSVLGSEKYMNKLQQAIDFEMASR